MEPPSMAMEPWDVMAPLLLVLEVASTVAPSITTELLPLIATVLPVVLTWAPPLMVVSEAVVEPAEPIRIAPAEPDPVAWDSISPEPLICRGVAAAGATLMSPPPPEPEALLLILLLEPSWRDPVVRLMELPCPEPEDEELS